MKKTIKHLGTMVFIMSLVIISCQKKDLLEVSENMMDNGLLKSTTTYCGDPYTATLTDFEQTVEAGEVIVGNDEDSVYVTFQAGDDWLLYSTYLYIGPAENVPGTLYPSDSGNFSQWLFPYRIWHSGGTQAYTFSFNQDELDECFIVVAYSNAENTATGSTHIVWGKSNAKSLGFYFDYCIQACEPPEECEPCEGGMTSLDLEYLGNEPNAIIKVYKDKVEPNKLIAGFTNVNQGDLISFTGTGPDNKLGAKIRITINGDNSNYTEIHTSCSQPIWAGMTYNDLFLIVAGTSKDGGNLCDLGNIPCGPCEKGMTSLSLEYLGNMVNANIKVYKDKVEPNKLLAEFTDVNMGDIISFIGTGKDHKLGSKIRLTINDDNSNYIEIHTSCSQPIAVGMIYEDTYKITAGTSKEGGPLCEEGAIPPGDCGECDGGVTGLSLEYLGYVIDANIKVYKDKVEPDKLLAEFTDVNMGDIISFIGTGKDHKLGAKIRLTINDDNSNYTEIHTSCSQPIYVGMIYEDTYKITAGTSKEGGPLCEEGAIPPGDCGECDGGVTGLSLEYLGYVIDANIKVYKDKVEPDKLLAEFTDVNMGDIISFIGTGKDHKLGSKIRLTINDDNSNYTEIHTSCSQPIYVGMIYEDTYKITAGTSKEGGPLCEEGTIPSGDCGECDGGVTGLSLEYLGYVIDANIKVYKDKVEPDKLLAEFTDVNMGDIISFIGTGKDHKLGAKIRLTINDDNSNYTEIHTSCSQPIYVGMIYEDTYKITAGTSKEGGPLCEE
ncbi:MAG: hypothetical protein KQI35_09975 [Bacteroidetes bacterium]|nr:hypothetical protein [Bacteroidota bacterium]